MDAIIWIAAAALIFGICRLVDIGFQKLFRNKAEHLSGLAVRVNKRYGVFGVILSAIGIAAMVTGSGGDKVLLYGGLNRAGAGHFSGGVLSELRHLL